MFNKLKRMFINGQLGEAELINAVGKGWITEDQKIEILLSVPGNVTNEQ